jgi:hypothetical protein
MIDTENVEHARLRARRRAVEVILKAEGPRDVWEARKEAKTMVPAAPALVVWEETIRLLGKTELYRQQVEVELATVRDRELFADDHPHFQGSKS